MIAYVRASVRNVCCALSCLASIQVHAQSAPATSATGLGGGARNTVAWNSEGRGTLILTQAVPRLLVGQRYQLSVGVLRQRSVVTVVDSVEWHSSEPSIAAVGLKGMLTGLKPGRSTITATAPSGSVRLRLTVYTPHRDERIASIEISPNTQDLEAGTSLQLLGTARGDDGAILPSAQIAWQTSDSSVAVVTTDGMLRLRRKGRASIQAYAEGARRAAEVSVVAPSFQYLNITPASLVLQTGDSATVRASASRRDGTPVDPAELKVTALRGRIAGSMYIAPPSPGGDSITVSASDGSTASSLVSVTASTPLAPAAPSSRIALRLTRFDNGAGSVGISSGIPLAPGQVRRGDESLVRLIINGAEVAASVTALKGLHTDGSLRAILVQAQVVVGATPVPAELWLGTSSSVPRLQTRAPESSPIAMAIPSSEQLVASRIVGPTVPIELTPPSLQPLDRLFRENSETQWIASGSEWSATNYYDRVFNHVGYWVRGGGNVFMRRALLIAVDYREKYLVANQFGSSPHWSQLEGLAVHYWLTGDEASRSAVLRTTDRLSAAFSVANLGRADYEWLDGRIQARVLLANALSSALEGDGVFAERAKEYVAAISATTLVDGSHAWPAFCGQQANYMAALQNDALVKYVELVGPDTRVAPLVKRSIDYLWRTQWNSAKQAFRYVSAQCNTVNEAETAPDLNMLFLTGFAWYSSHANDPDYRVRADQIAFGGLASAWIVPTKQFNQFYYQVFNYLSYRRN